MVEEYSLEAVILVGVSNCGNCVVGVCACVFLLVGWSTQHIYMTGVQLLSLHNNNNRRRDVFCAKKEVRDGRLKGEEGGDKIKC